ncbi:flagellar biosynthesis protein FlgG [Helicobacter pylori]|uniref:flagellar biosynthesis protein FlgG n=1 Tax=Helicobacter pylori TaxID=210 RepID=UPI0019217CD6|nr:flagellar biosynthesis protein FlgG [Helicobacter pylori]QQW88623.1 flagellar biosynthesis protein FlgG [Helicobacter pylori]
MIYVLAVFFPWLAFLLRGRIFSAIFSFILWVSTILEILVFGSFLLWVVLTVWCCSVMYGDRRREEMERLIEVIEATGKSLHYETQQDKTQQANKTKKMWYLAIIFLISLAILAVFFFIKREHQPNNNASNNQPSAIQKIDAKNPNSKNHKKSNSHSKVQNHSKCKNNKEVQAKER